MTDDASRGGTTATVLRAAGALIALVALVFVLAPTLVHDPGPAPDLFEAIERRVRWGLGISFGLMLVVHPWRRPWSVVVAWGVFCASGGYLIARILGMAIEGLGSQKQWVFTVVEIAICVLAAAWVRYRRDAPDRAGSETPSA